jgi:hypothetical protein
MIAKEDVGVDRGSKNARQFPQGVHVAGIESALKAATKLNLAIGDGKQFVNLLGGCIHGFLTEDVPSIVGGLFDDLSVRKRRRTTDNSIQFFLLCGF